MFSITPIDLQVDLARHVRGPLRDLLRGGLRRRDDDDLGAREELRHRQRDVAGAGRHVDDEVVGLAPVHVGEELLERLVQHRAAPDDRLVLAGEEAHRDERDAVGFGRDDHVVDDGRRPVDAEHARHREAPHVGVDRGDLVAALRERDREVGRDRRLADAALARRDREHAGAGVGERVRCAAASARPSPPSRAAAALSGLRARSSVMTVRSTSTRSTPASATTASVTRRGDLGPQRAARDRERDRHADAVAVDRDAPDHVEIDDRRWISGSSTGRRASSDLGFSVGICGRLRGISTTGVGRIPVVTATRPHSGRVRGRRRRRHDRLRRPDPPRHLPLRPDPPDGVQRPPRSPSSFALHPNVARHHLEKLAAGGYLDVELARHESAGRPSKRYRASRRRHATSRSRPAATTCSARCSPRALERLPVDEARDDRRRGRLRVRPRDRGAHGAAEGHRSVKAAVASVADALTAHGFAAHAESRGNALTLVAEHCPFGEAARQYPHVLCAVDTGMVKGMLEGLYGETAADDRAEPAARRRRTASPASERSSRARTSTTRRRHRCAPPRSRRCSRSCASTTPIPAACTPKGG